MYLGLQAHRDALNVIALETRTAESVMNKADARKANGKRITREELKELVPLFLWDDFFHGIEMPDVGLVSPCPHLPALAHLHTFMAFKQPRAMAHYRTQRHDT